MTTKGMHCFPVLSFFFTHRRLDSSCSCLHLPRAGIAGLHHHTKFMQCWEIKPKASLMLQPSLCFPIFKLLFGAANSSMCGVRAYAHAHELLGGNENKERETPTESEQQRKRNGLHSSFLFRMCREPQASVNASPIPSPPTQLLPFTSALDRERVHSKAKVSFPHPQTQVPQKQSDLKQRD